MNVSSHLENAYTPQIPHRLRHTQLPKINTLIHTDIAI